MKKLLFILLAAMLLAAGGGWHARQTLAPLREAADAAWTDADGAIRKRAELVPALIAEVERYTSEEQAAVRAAEAARRQVTDGQTPEARMAASDALSSALGRLLLAADRYRGLRASPAYRRLLTDLAAADNTLAVARQGYNEAAQRYNSALRAFPQNFYSGLLGFEPAPYFKVTRLR